MQVNLDDLNPEQREAAVLLQSAGMRIYRASQVREYVSHAIIMPELLYSSRVLAEGYLSTVKDQMIAEIIQMMSAEKVFSATVRDEIEGQRVEVALTVVLPSP